MVRCLHVVREMQGGMLTHVATLLKGLASAGAEPAVAGPAATLDRLRRRLGELGVEPAACRWWEAPLRDGLRPVDDLRARRALREAVQCLQPAVVHAHGLKAATVAAWACGGGPRGHGPGRRPRLVCSVHGPLPAGTPGWRGRWRAALARRSLSVADRVIAVSGSLAAQLAGWLGSGWVDGRLRVIPNGLDPSWWAPNGTTGPARAAGRAAGRQWLVATCMARLTRVKGVDLLLQAATLLEPGLPLRIWVAGDGPDRCRLAAEVRRLGLGRRVRLLGFVPDARRLWERSDLAIIPSAAEGFSYAALEAMACGLPVVATAVGGLVELLEGGCGELVPPGSPEALAATLERLVRRPGLRQELGRKARRRALERYRGDAMVASVLEVYREVAVGP